MFICRSIYLLIGFEAEAFVSLQPEDGGEGNENGDQDQHDGSNRWASHALSLKYKQTVFKETGKEDKEYVHLVNFTVYLFLEKIADLPECH